MALQSNFLGTKRESLPNRLAAVAPIGEAPQAAPATPAPAAAIPPAFLVSPAAPPPFPGAPAPLATRPATAAEPAREAVRTRAPLAAAAAPAPAPAPASAPDSPSKLTVGPNIKLKGVEITDCDTLVVEGFVEATMDSRVIQIERSGAFDGSARVDLAVIRGVFRGTLDAREQLVIHATGRVAGKVRYGSLVVEEGGQLTGELIAGSPTAG